MNINRRRFLKVSAGAAAYAAASFGLPGTVKAGTPWGVLPASAGDLPKYKVLEIFCPGGVSQWENLWVSHDGPENGNLNWRGVAEYVQNLNWNECVGAPPYSVKTQAFEEDANGTPISWGPATAPLWRPDILNRSRMLVTQHADDIHAFAGYRTLTGRRFGSPRGASLGAAIQRHYQSIGHQDIPYSYVFAPKHLGKAYVLTNAMLIGQHPGPSRPIGLKVGDAIGNLLQRDGISGSADAIFNKLRDQYRDLLRWQGVGSPVRSPDFASYDSAGDYLVKGGQLDQHLGGDAMVAGTSVPCTSDPDHSFGELDNPTKRSLELAAHMLNNGARHITVIDGGLPDSLLRNSGTPYDAHNNAPGKSRNVVETTSVHLFNLLQSLAAVIQGPENTLASKALASPSGPKIDLDDTIVLIHSEFNRTPNPGTGVNGNGYAYAGREHFPAATVALLIGGPVTERGIFGGIELVDNDPNTARATTPLSPTDVHAGAMLAAGIDPIDPDNFTVGDDFSNQVNPGGNAYADEIRMHLKQKVLGVQNSIGSTLVGNS